MRLQRAQMPDSGLKRRQTYGVTAEKPLEKSWGFHFVDSWLWTHAAAGVVQTFPRYKNYQTGIQIRMR